MGLWPGAGRLPSECGVAGYPVFWMGLHGWQEGAEDKDALGVSTFPDLGVGRPGRRRRYSGGTVMKNLFYLSALALELTSSFL